MKKELFPGVEVSYKKFGDVKFDGFMCSLYISEPLQFRGVEGLSYSAFIVPLRYKDNKARYPIYLRCGFTERHYVESYIEDEQIVRLMQITDYDGFATPDYLRQRFYQCIVNNTGNLRRYSNKHFAMHCKLHGVKRVG